MPALSGDSGQRSASASGAERSASGSRSDSGAGRLVSPTFGLAATEHDAGASREGALARSEAGVAVGPGSTKERSSTVLMVGGALVLTACVAIALVFSLRTTTTGRTAAAAAALAVVAAKTRWKTATRACVRK